jgi:putative nucleotidyltransferase with HDIG domain
MVHGDTPLLKAVLAHARRQKVELFAVGGHVRDLLLHRRKFPPDIDFCVRRNAIAYTRALARTLRAGFVVLDQEHGCARAVVPYPKGPLTIDITDFRGPTLAEDLYHRDFTINAMAVPLASLARGLLRTALVDPYHGVMDVRARCVRMVSPHAFNEDPVRIMRAFSIAAQLGFSIDPQTKRTLLRARALLKSAAQERVRDEFFKILQSDRAHESVMLLERMKVLTHVMPEIELMRGVRQGPYHHLDVYKHSLAALAELEPLLRRYQRLPQIAAYLNEEYSSGRTRAALIKLGVLLHDVGKPRAKRRRGNKTVFYGHERAGLRFVEQLCMRLKLSNAETQALRMFVMLHLRPGYLGDQERPSPRAVFRFFRDAGNESVAVLLLSLADQRATRGRLTTREDASRHERVCARLIKSWCKQQRAPARVRLVDGHILMRELKLSPSPLIGKMLRHIEELQALGKVRTRAQAIAAARALR